ncbi:MAG: MATE family efflux transporter [Oscillospiraceae bacterium]
MAVPAVTAQVINMLYNLVDRIYIGHIPETGSLALTGLGVCMPVIMVISAFAAIISMGGAPKASLYMGKRDNAYAEKILGGCFALQLVLSAVLTAVLLIWNRQFLLAFGASENTIEYASGYMTIYAIGTVFVQLTLGMNAFITAQGFARTGMFTVLIGAVLNIVLDPLFIFALDMGVQGAALATIISQAVSAAWVVRFLTGKNTILKIRAANIRIRREIIIPCIGLGVAPFIMQASESILYVCMNSSLLKYGGDLAVGAMTIISSVTQFSLLPMQGIGQGSIPITSYNFGAKNRERVKQSFKKLLMAMVCYSVTLWVLVMLFPAFFSRLLTPDTELIEYSAWALRIYFAGMCLMGVQLSCQMTFVSISYSVSSVIVAVVRKFVLLIPLVYILPHFFADKAMAVYLAEPVSDLLAVTFTSILFAFQFRKALKTI